MLPDQTKKQSTDEEAPAALESIRVLDMTWAGPGPFCATVLSLPRSW